IVSSISGVIENRSFLYLVEPVGGLFPFVLVPKDETKHGCKQDQHHSSDKMKLHGYSFAFLWVVYRFSASDG
ncbi:MAG: hypothetical protein ACOC23_07385, partial [Thermodesulfobacteriota bacterium]